MNLFFRDRSVYERAVRHTAEGLIAAHGKTADLAAWQVARKTSLTRTERAYCEAVATFVSQRLSALRA
jgi:hypothetical protein